MTPVSISTQSSKSVASGWFARAANPEAINYLNIGLMLLSCAVAFVLPFELFLFAYGVLGPLHYLTEISWLAKKNYFVRSKRDMGLFVVTALLLVLAGLNVQSRLYVHRTTLFFASFAFAFVILFADKTWKKLLWLIAAFLLFAVVGLDQTPSMQIVFAILLPTILHVFVFTGAFILYGALKGRSTTGVVSFLVFLACAGLFLVYTPAPGHLAGEYARKAYGMFAVLNKTLSDLLGIGVIRNMDDVFTDGGAVGIMRFVAFAYTYHYLNWFSKTSVIKWHEIPAGRMAGILVLWLLSAGIFLYDYKTGFYTLLFLSLLHIFLEFPLNHQTFIGIGRELKAALGKG